MTNNELSVIIIRGESTADYTSGIFYIKNGATTLYRGVTLELGVGKCIPIGWYNVEWRYSPKNKTYTPLLYNENVAKERYIEMHVGNTIQDTQGCILVGKHAENHNHIVESREAFAKLQFILQFKEFKVKIS